MELTFVGLFCETKPGHYRTVVGNIQVIELFCQTAVPQGFQTTPDENIVQPHVFSQAAVIVVRPFGSVTNRCDGTRMGQVFGVGRIEQDPDRFGIGFGVEIAGDDYRQVTGQGAESV